MSSITLRTLTAALVVLAVSNIALAETKIVADEVGIGTPPEVLRFEYDPNTGRVKIEMKGLGNVLSVQRKQGGGAFKQVIEFDSDPGDLHNAVILDTYLQSDGQEVITYKTKVEKDGDCYEVEHTVTPDSPGPPPTPTTITHSEPVQVSC